MTLSRGVIDLRSQLWEHGQLYVALSRFRDPSDICILLPTPDEESDHVLNEDILINPVAETEIVRMVNDIENSCKNHEEYDLVSEEENQNGVQNKVFSESDISSDFLSDSEF